MKKVLLFAALFAAMLTAPAFAEDGPVVSTPFPDAYCEAPPPPVCQPLPEMCNTAPAKKVVYEDEKYTVNEYQTETVYEQRTRQVARRYDVLHEKVVTDTKIAKVEGVTGKQPRLARGKTLRKKEYTKKETFMEDEDYLQPMRLTHVVPVERTRKVAKIVDAD